MDLTQAPLSPSDTDVVLDPLTQAALTGVTRALASVGRAFVCMDHSFRIVHASHVLDQFLGEGISKRLPGCPIESLLGEDLLGRNGRLRQALLDGEKREGWRATLRFENAGPRLVSITAAPLLPEAENVCDPRVAYLILLRPAEESESCEGAPTFFSGAIACSPIMQKIFRLVETLQQSEATILISGESGTGKEIVARAIHQNSGRRNGPFVPVNCGALPADLLESELFGHVRGAFTGAVRDRTGRFEMASTGTIFLDEIGDLPLPLQVKLLRVLQERTYERVGESITRTTNARILAATNTNLKRALMQGQFREDLYYRLCVVPIEVPPLRDRREDIAPLSSHLLTRVAAQQGLVKRISPQAMRLLLDYSWPGNVRELNNTIEYSVAVSKQETILPEDLPEEIRYPRPPAQSEAQALVPPHLPNRNLKEEDEAERLITALEAHHWRRDDAARALGLSRTTLWRKMREFHLV